MRGSSIGKSKRKDRLKTLCTLDTYDINFFQTYNKGKENDNRSRNCPYLANTSKSASNKKKTSIGHNKSQYSAFNYSRLRDSTCNKFKINRASSISQTPANRVKTDYSEHQQKQSKKMNESIAKKFVFPVQDNYKFDCWEVIKRIYIGEQEEVSQVREEMTKKEKCVMIKVKSLGKKRILQKQMKAYDNICSVMKQKERMFFYKIKKLLRDKKDWIALAENYYHPLWQNDQFYIFMNSFKMHNESLSTLIKQSAKGIQILSKYGYVHGNIGIESLFFSIGKVGLRIDQTVKLGNLRNSFPIESKQSFLGMPNLYRSPPEILNLIRFQMQEDFDREYLEVISKIEAAWQIDVWALGILILELLNGGRLSGEGSERGQLISLQKQLLIRYSYLLAKLQSNVKHLLTRMLSLNPTERPHPREIIRCL